MTRFADNLMGPFKIAVIYATVAGLWILFSDELLAHLVTDPAIITRLSILKGWLFVIITAAMLFVLVGRYVTALLHRDDSLRQNLQRREHQLEILSSASRQINTVLELPAVKQALVASAMLLVKAQGCGAGLMENGKLVFVDYTNKGETIPISYSFERGNGVPGWVMETRKPYMSNDAEHDPHVVPEIQKALGFFNLIDVPILSRTGEMLGCLEVHNKEGDPFDELDVTMLQSLADSAAAALENAGMLAGLMRGEEALHNQFRQVTTIFDAVNAVIYVSNPATHELLYLNKFGAVLFGENWQGKHCYDILHAGQVDACSFCTSDQLDVDGEPQLPFVWEFKNAVTGRWFQCLDREIRWTDGSLVRVEIAFDISDRKEIEQMKDEMVSAVSHEMRTPLTAMLGYTEYMLENEVPLAEQKEYLRTIHNETVRLNELIGNFLDLQRLKMRPGEPSIDYLSVEQLLKEAATLFSNSGQKHPIDMDVPVDLPQIVGIAGQIHQVLVNLISNAIKYSPVGSRITLGARREGETVVIRVRDEGMGIPAELSEKIFERFYRIDNTDRRLIGGAGLGLALVREIVAAHNGKVWVESVVGKGSIFSVQLPTKPQDS